MADGRLAYGGLPRGDFARGGKESTTYANSGASRGVVESGTDIGGNPANPALTAPTPTVGSPLTVFIVVLLFIVGMRFFANKAGEENEYSALMPTFYNVMLITFASILGISFLKFLSGSYLPENNAVRRFIFTV